MENQSKKICMKIIPNCTELWRKMGKILIVRGVYENEKLMKTQTHTQHTHTPKPFKTTHISQQSAQEIIRAHHYHRYTK